MVMPRPRRVRFLAAAALAAGALVTFKAGEVGHRLVFGIGAATAEETAEAATDTDAGHETAEAESAPAQDPESVQFDELTPGDIELLQQLAARRAELDARERDLATREQALELVEGRVAERIAQLKTLQETVEALVATHDEAQEAKLASLVKIYQNMKPKDAAPIFDELEPTILLDVIERMKEAKVAPILALMNPDRARAVTQDLARRRDLPEPSAAAAEPATTAAEPATTAAAEPAEAAPEDAAN